MTITEPTTSEVAEAADAVEHYKAVLRAGKSYIPEEDEIMLAMYRQLAQGRQVINAFDAIREGGADDLERPRLFLARAHWDRVIWSPYGNGRGHFRQFGRQIHERGTRHYISIPEGTLNHDRWNGDHWSVVPSIPPLLRPRGRIDGYIILSEANWQAVPKDPALLRPIKWPLCAVVAVWDLTEIERKVLGITRVGNQ